MPHPPHPLATVSQILVTPSGSDGVSPQLEDDLRAAGCMLIQEAGVLLDLPQSTAATAQVLLQRFFYVSSLLAFSVYDTAIAALYLSSKLCESPVRLRDLLNVHTLLLARNAHLCAHPEALRAELARGAGTGPGLPAPLPLADWTFRAPSLHAEAFYTLKDALVIAEIQILKRLGFNTHVDLPYAHTVNYCKILDLVPGPAVQRAWAILNDALATPLYAQHTPPTLACFAILLATRIARTPMPARWWELFDAEWEDIWSCAGTMMRAWDRWGCGAERGMAAGGTASDKAGRTDVWVRAWTLATSKRQLRRWIERENDLYGGKDSAAAAAAFNDTS